MIITIAGKIFQKPLFVFALESEAGNEFDEFRKVIAGVGKLNTAYYVLKAIQQEKPDCIINLGTAGSTVFPRSEIVCCTRFVQRDMEVTALGFKKFETPFSGEPVILEYGLEISGLPKGICGSGDQFETEHCNPEYTVIDMEAFAIATIAKREKIPFLCLKYISDGADGNAVSDWNTEVKSAAKALREALGV